MKAVVIGSGFSSLSAACYLAKAGLEVTLLEKNSEPGGRARQYIKDGFTFDIGPTWYWMPDVFENFFADFNRKANDYYKISRLNPSYRIYAGENKYEDIPADKNALLALFEKYQPGSSKLLNEFLTQAELTYKLAVQEMAFKPGHTLTEFVSKDTIRNAHLFILSLRSQVRKKFKHPFLISLLEFPVLFLGAKPGDTPAFYNFMNYADLELGTWYPEGGMYSVVKGILKLAGELGVNIITGCGVNKLVVENNVITGVETTNGIIEADVVVSGADYEHTESLLENKYRNYDSRYWNSRTFAPSALLFFLGINKKFKNMLHHDLFFDEPFDAHASAIYDNPEWPERPLFYINVPSITEKAMAPEGCESVTILVPLAPGLKDTEEIREEYYHSILNRFERITGESIIEHVVVKKSYCINDFISDYNAYKGNAYGLANTLFQTGYFRPKIKSKKVKNLYFCGQLTVPGGGVPPALISGKIAAEEIKKKQNELIH
jgi:phytoene desaturase